MTDYLVGIGITLAISAISSIWVAYIKKGKFENWGKAFGRFMSKLGNTRLGSKKWEKVEDIITLSILSFAKGIKLGADEDDKEMDRIEEKSNGGDK